MKYLSVALLAVLMCLAPGAAQATTITHSSVAWANWVTVDWTDQLLTFAQFDTSPIITSLCSGCSLVLDDVKLVFTGSVEGTISLYESGTGTVKGTTIESMSILDPANALLSNLSLNFNTGYESPGPNPGNVYPTGAGSGIMTCALAKTTGGDTTDFGSTYCYTATSTYNGTFTGTGMDPYLGTGNVSFHLQTSTGIFVQTLGDAGVTGGGEITAGNATGTLQLDYHITENNTPEPFTLAMLGSGLGLLGLVGRKRFKR
jgi:hypothetical protein